MCDCVSPGRKRPGLTDVANQLRRGLSVSGSILTPRIPFSALSRRLSSSDAVSPREVVSPALPMPRMSPGWARSPATGARVSSRSRSSSRSISALRARSRASSRGAGAGPQSRARPSARARPVRARDPPIAASPLRWRPSDGRRGARKDRARPGGGIPPGRRGVVVGGVARVDCCGPRDAARAPHALVIAAGAPRP